MRWGFAVGAWVLGNLPLPLAFALAPNGDLGTSAPGLNLPSWLFAAIWTVIYPCLGIATWRVWCRRDQPGAVEALAVFGLCFVVLLAFVPITAAAHEQLVTAMFDLVGLVAAFVAAWAYRRIDAGTLPWMAPLLLWMPTTAALKWATLPG